MNTETSDSFTPGPWTAALFAPMPGKGWAYLILPFDSVAAFGTRGRVPVQMTIGGQIFRTSIFPYGDGTHQVMINRTMREAGGIGASEDLTFHIEKDDAPRAEDPEPDELTAVLDADPDARSRFEALAPSHRREHIRHIVEAARPETRQRRAEKTVALLHEKAQAKTS